MLSPSSTLAPHQPSPSTGYSNSSQRQPASLGKVSLTARPGQAPSRQHPPRGLRSGGSRPGPRAPGKAEAAKVTLRAPRAARVQGRGPGRAPSGPPPAPGPCALPARPGPTWPRAPLRRPRAAARTEGGGGPAPARAARRGGGLCAARPRLRVGARLLLRGAGGSPRPLPRPAPRRPGPARRRAAPPARTGPARARSRPRAPAPCALPPGSRPPRPRLGPRRPPGPGARIPPLRGRPAPSPRSPQPRPPSAGRGERGGAPSPPEPRAALGTACRGVRGSFLVPGHLLHGQDPNWEHRGACPWRDTDPRTPQSHTHTHWIRPGSSSWSPFCLLVSHPWPSGWP